MKDHNIILDIFPAVNSQNWLYHFWTNILQYERSQKSWIITSLWWKLLNTASLNFKFRFVIAAATCGKVSGWGSKTRLYLKGLIFIKAVSAFKNLTISWTTSFHSLKSLSCNQIIWRSFPIHPQMKIYHSIFLTASCFHVALHYIVYRVAWLY